MSSPKSCNSTSRNLPEATRRNFIQQTAATTAVATVMAPFMGCSNTPKNLTTSQCPAPTGLVSMSYAVSDSMVQKFTALSEALTGVKPLPADLARQYLERMAANPWVNSSIAKLLGAFDVAMRRRVVLGEDDLRHAFFRDPDIRLVAQQAIYLWYVSAFYLPVSKDDPTPRWWYGTVDQYQRALVWSVMHAHAPMTTGPNWTSRPQTN